MGCGALEARAFTAADADTLFDSHIKAFYREQDGRAWFTKDTEGGKADFWKRAEELEMVLVKDRHGPMAPSMVR
jgi:hypothetical protein